MSVRTLWVPGLGAGFPAGQDPGSQPLAQVGTATSRVAEDIALV